MSDQASTRGTQADRGAPGTEPLRVILVGRTGLDARLRRDPAMELVRVALPLEAVGELGRPTDGASPARSVVIVGSDVSFNGEGSPPGEAARFVAALRRVDPAVRTLRVESDGRAEEFDGALGPDASPEVVRALADRARAAPALEPEPVEAEIEVLTMPAPAPPTIEVPSRGEAESLIEGMVAARRGAGDVGDEALVRQALHGRPVLEAALELIRRRVGARDVAFEPGPGEGVAVAWRGRILGRLRCPRVRDEALAAHAAWLGGWLALDEQRAQLREAAFRDPLTGAYNRRYFDQFLSAAITRARAQRRSLTILMFDIDNFKEFNDRHGHGAGDEILLETVRLLSSVTRPSDRICRIGGDEFAVIFHEPHGPRAPDSRHPSSIFEIARRFQKQVSEARFPKLGREAPGTLTISGGLATFPWDGTDPASLLARADALALQSKQQGKNAIRFGPGAEDRMRDGEGAGGA